MKNCVSLLSVPPAVGHRDLIDAGKRQLLQVLVGKRRSGLPAASAAVQRRGAPLHDEERRCQPKLVTMRGKEFACIHIITIIGELVDHLHGVGREVA